MSYDPTCFNDIIGFSRTTCDCYDVTNYTDSKSGLYLSELEGVNIKSLNDLPDCDKGIMTERYYTAYQNAIQYLRNDVQMEASKHFGQRFSPFVGNIGLAQKDATYTGITQTYAYIRLMCRQLVGATMTIKGINTIFEGTGVKTVWLYNNLNELLGTYQLNTTANTYTTNNITDIELDLFDARVDYPEYFLVYEVAGNRPKNNALNCQKCGNVYSFNRSKPCWNINPAKKIGWQNYVCVASGQTDTLDFEAASTLNNSGFGTYMLGLVLDVDIKCDFKQFLCSADFDFDNEPVAKGIAVALRFKTGSLMLHDILASGEINRWTMIDHDSLLANIAYYDERYKAIYEWLGENIDTTKSDCWICKEYHGFTAGTIRV